MRWPSSNEYLRAAYPSLRAQLCHRSLQWGALRQLLNPWNLRFLLSRSNLLGLALQKEWEITAKLGELPRMPEWSVNGTTAENGKRFRFKAADMGDYELGYASCVDFPLSHALAVSAAFPGGFGPLAIKTDQFTWFKRPWGAPLENTAPVKPVHRRVHLYDGGVYDNIGLEPLFDAGRSKSKIGDACIVVSDAGAPLSIGFRFAPLNVFRLKRVADIISDQAHALRVRTFSAYIKADPQRGALICIGTEIGDKDSDASAQFAKGFPTTLRKLNQHEFDSLASHGQAVAADSRLQVKLA